MEKYTAATSLGIAFGVITRYLVLRSDYRQYPGYPHGYITHLSLGLIAAVLGALAIPALAEKEFTAVTFLSLAATQFRDVREMERKTLAGLDLTNLVSRGPDYIEDISRIFEARNYLVMLIALLVGGVAYYTHYAIALVSGGLALIGARYLMHGRVVGQVAQVRPGKVHFEGPNLFVEDIHMMNLAREEVRQQVKKRGLGVILEPFDDDARAILGNSGQRMAIAHDASVQLGIYKDVDTAEFTPLLRRDLDTGRVAMIILPLEMDLECLLLAITRVPVLESAINRPLKSRAGYRAAD